MQHLKASESMRRPARDVEMEVEADREADSVPREQALAVWRIERANLANALPRELAHTAIVHYTDPGDLVLAPKLRGGELLQTAAALGRRALPLAPSTSSTDDAEAVIPLRPGASAALVLAPLAAHASERRLARVAAMLFPLLRPGGFLALARGRRVVRSDALGAVVHACQENGLQYWQHVVALTSAVAADDESGACAARAGACRRRTRGDRAIRCHHDLVVFRRPEHANAEHATGAVVGAVAA
jgi:hypothetical protein